MTFNTTFNNISVISWRSVLLVEETGVSRENHRPAARHSQTLSHNGVSSTPHYDRSKYENEMSQNNVKTLLVYCAIFNRSSVMSWRFIGGENHQLQVTENLYHISSSY
jgi:hypothetical protein